MTLTPEQLELRRNGLTATDMVRIAGVSPFGGPRDVLDEKLGLNPPWDQTERAKWGHLLEPVVRQEYADRHGVSVVVPGTMVHRENRWAMATPDGLVNAFAANKLGELIPVGTGKFPAQGIAHADRGLEIKTHTIWLRDSYGEPDTDEVPAYEAVQCAWNMYIARSYAVELERWDLVAFIDGLPTDYQVYRDPELEEMLVDMGETFWFEHVVGGKPLKPDGSKSYTEFLKRNYPRDRFADFVQVDPSSGMAETIAELCSVRSEKRMLKRIEDQLVQEVKEFIGNHAGAEFESLHREGEYDRITWKKTRDSQPVDWEAAFGELRNYIELRESASGDDNVALNKYLGELIARHTKTKSGSRRFNVPRIWDK